MRSSRDGLLSSLSRPEEPKELCWELALLQRSHVESGNLPRTHASEPEYVPGRDDLTGNCRGQSRAPMDSFGRRVRGVADRPTKWPKGLPSFSFVTVGDGSCGLLKTTCCCSGPAGINP